MEDNQYRCESCNGIMEFDPVTQTLKCPNCDSTMEIIKEDKIEEHPLTLDDRRSIKAEAKESKTMVCSGCGAHMEVAGNETAAKCPYCDSTYVIASEQEETLVPDGVIPFKIDKKELGKRFADWIKKKWLAPGELKRLYQAGGFQGVYVPYWTFDADTNCTYQAMGGRDRQVHYTDSDGNKKTRTETDWYYTHGHLHRFFDDVQVPASTRFKKGLFSGLEPFDFKELEGYSPSFFAGHMSENYSIGLEEGHRDAVSEMESTLRQDATNDVRRRYDRVKDVRIQVRYKDESYKYVMLPVYSTAYSYKDKNYTVLINGQTGKIKGEYPKSPIKIALIVVAVIILVVLGYIFTQSGSDKDYGYNSYQSSYEYVSEDTISQSYDYNEYYNYVLEEDI